MGQDHLFTSLSDVSHRFLISLADLIWSTHPSIAQSMQTVDKLSIGSQVSRFFCGILTNDRPGEVGLQNLKIVPITFKVSFFISVRSV
jgi:hypothetical protein